MSDAVAVARGEESAEAAATAAVTTGGVAAAAAASEAAGTAAEAAASRTGSTAERGGATEEEDEDTGQTNKPKEAQVNDNVESEVDDALLIQDPKSESVTLSLPSHQVSPSPSAPPPDKSPPSEYTLPISVINHYIHCVEG